MAEQKQDKKKHEETLVEIEPVKQIEVETKDLVVSSKLFIYVIIGLLTYLIFLVIPEIFLEAVFLSITPVLAIFINCEWNFGRKLLASLIFPDSRYIDIFFTADLHCFAYTVDCRPRPRTLW